MKESASDQREWNKMASYRHFCLLSVILISTHNTTKVGIGLTPGLILFKLTGFIW
jgi:hypothetical protein